MKNATKKILSGLLSCCSVTTLNALADTKVLTCNMVQKDRIEKREFVFDTNDFSKENPYHETRLLESNEDRNKYLINEERANLLGINPVKVFDSLGVGNIYRMPYEVSPGYLTFTYIWSPECLNIAGAGAESICVYAMEEDKISISRKTLRGTDEELKREFSCEIADYREEENVI